MGRKKGYTQEEYDAAMKIAVAWNKEGYVCHWAEEVLIQGTKEMWDKLYAYMKNQPPDIISWLTFK